MDYKEEYLNALERAKKGLPLDEVFPELKESEDERIRKAINDVLHLDNDEIRGILELHGISYSDAWDYLEKQKENPLMVEFANEL